MMGRTWGWFALVVLCSFPASAFAAGYEYPDNGAKALAQGAAFAAEPIDGTALYYNPAGLAGQTGWRVLIDGQAVWLNTTFQRQDADGTNIGNAVSNDYAPWLAPFLSVSYGILPNLTIAAGVYGPSAYGSQRYPDPRKIEPTFFDGNPSNDPTDHTDIVQQAPQRFALIDSDLLVLYPSLAVGWSPVEWLSIGGTVQLALSTTKFSQSIYGGLAAGEDPQFEGIASLDIKGDPVLTGIIGLTVRPAEGLSLGASWRPGFTAKGTGTLDVQFNDFLVNGFGLEQTKNDAAFDTVFPDVLRFGVAVHDVARRFGGEFDGVYEGWGAVQNFTVKPDVEIYMGGSDTPLPVEDIVIPKNWSDTFSLRFGLWTDLAKLGTGVPLTIRAGYIYEESAIPNSTLNLDFPAWQRNQGTFGLTYDLGFLAITATASHIWQPQKKVNDSLVTEAVAPPAGVSYQGTVVGNGVYDASYTLLVIGLEGRFGIGQ